MGKGKEYSYDGNLIFKGEYKNDKKWNGKGYNSLNNIIYELKEGKGLIKEYDYNGKLTFEGVYKYGRRNGILKEYANGKLRFDGEYLNEKEMESEKNMMKISN